MATLVLAAAGQAIGAAVGGSVLGFSAVAIGGAIGTVAGSYVDNLLLSQGGETQRAEGPRVDQLQVGGAAEGAVLPRVYGRFRVGGQIIWATDFEEDSDTETVGGGKGGGGGGQEVTTYTYRASWAVAICEGLIDGIGRVWADGRLLDLSKIPHRLYIGTETQPVDPLIAAKGGDSAPAYRGTAYIVFERVELGQFGNRLPNISVEVLNPLAEQPDVMEALAKAVTLIPSTGEAAYATTTIFEGSPRSSAAENRNTGLSDTDVIVSLDRLQATMPNVKSVSVVVSWFGSDLRAGECEIRPRVEVNDKMQTPRAWSVQGLTRAMVPETSKVGGRPAYGGTPADADVIELIAELKARGFRVTFYPFILMDVPAGNALPNPYSDNAAAVGQPVYPWRGRITCSPAAGFAGTVDKTAGAGTQIAAFFGSADPSDFSTAQDGAISYTGPAGDWGLRRMILHYANICAAAGGVDAFLIGTELRGITQVRESASSYPAVAALRSLAADVRGIVGAGTAISYAADWSEYFGHQPADGSGDVFFHLDPLWTDAEIDFVGIDNYMPLSDWRCGTVHADAQAGWTSVNHRAYLLSNVQGGEGFDWFYASAADREAQVRTTIADGAYGEPWVFRYKDLPNWWSNAHHDRPGGVRSVSSTGWVPQSKPIRFTEIGCPALDRAANQPNVFFDPKSSESFLPYFSRGWRDDAMQRAYIEASLLHWGDPANNPASGVYPGRMLDMDEAALWTWDARPYPEFPARGDVWSDGDNWRLGHWLTGRAGSAPFAPLIRDLAARVGVSSSEVDVSSIWHVVEGVAITAIESPRASIIPLARYAGIDATESGGLLRFIDRSTVPQATLTDDDLLAAEEGAALEFLRAQETELPRAIRWQVARADEEYDAAMVEAARIATPSERVSVEAFPFCASPEQAERYARRTLVETWIARETATAGVRPSLLALDPGDAVWIERGGQTEAYRITSTSDSEGRSVEAARAGSTSELAAAPRDPRRPKLRPAPVSGPPLVYLLNLPQLASEVAEGAAYGAAFSSPWPGPLGLWRSSDGLSYALAGTIDLRAKVGELTASLPAGDPWRWNNGVTLEADFGPDQIGSVTDEALLAGANVFAVESSSGVWEVLQAATADLQPSGIYHLSRLLRGVRGTEANIGDPTPSGAPIVKLDLRISPVPISSSEIGASLMYRAGPLSEGPDGERVSSLTFAGTARGLRAFSPAQPRARRLPSGDLAIRWVRRSRSLDADGWEIAAPLLEAAELYEIEILNAGGALVASVSGISEPAYTWTAADQVAALGALSDRVRARVYQLGATGRGDTLSIDIPISEAE